MLFVRALAAFFGLVLGAVALEPAPASARTPYDGSWSVVIVTNRGSCDRTYRYRLAIRDGAVFYQGSAPVNVRGRVNGNGDVSVQVWAGGQWRGNGFMGSCSGFWIAERR